MSGSVYVGLARLFHIYCLVELHSLTLLPGVEVPSNQSPLPYIGVKRPPNFNSKQLGFFYGHIVETNFSVNLGRARKEVISSSKIYYSAIICWI